MKIAHISDLHIRNFKYRDEYRQAFQSLYDQLDELQPDVVINTGDTVHSKLAVSPELFDDVAAHMLAVSEIAPYWIVLGNHDLNLKNVARTDAISPIVRALQGRTKHRVSLLMHPTSYGFERHPEFVFWNYSIRHPGHVFQSTPNADQVNIGLYHGSISGCVTDQGFIMEEGEADLNKFKGMDFVMLGDIHKRQSFRDGRVRYPGSLIQQNYGEELVKGFLLWDIRGKDDFVVDFHEVKAPGRFFTIQVPQSLDLTGLSVPRGSRIRALVDGGLSPSRRMKLEEALVKAFDPIEVIAPDVSDDKAQSEPIDIDELVGSREKVMRDHLSASGADRDSIEAVVKLFSQYEASIDSDSAGRGTTWQLKSIAWDNMMNYGEGSSIDFTKLSGLVGIFGPNAIGKSSIFDILLEALFDKVAKDVPRNIDLVNDNKDTGLMHVAFESNGTLYDIERTIERIQYGQRKLAETKQWGKTVLDFSAGDNSLNGTTRPETERAIRSIIGSFEDFVLTAMLSQNPIFGLPGGADILNCKETDRRKILFRFLDLDVYEKVGALAKDDLKPLMGKLKELDGDTLRSQLASLRSEREGLERSASTDRSLMSSLEDSLGAVQRELDRFNARNAQEMSRERDRQVERRNGLTASIAEARRRMGKARSDLDGLVRNRESHVRKRPAEGPIPLDRLQKEMADLRVKREEAIGATSRLDQRIKQGRLSLATLDGIPCESRFPSCKFISEATGFIGIKDELERALAGLIENRESIGSQLKSLEEYELIHKDFTKWQQGLLNLERDISLTERTLDAENAAIDRAEQDLSVAALRIAELDLLLEQSSIEAISGLREEQRFLEESIAALRRGIDSSLRTCGALDSRIEKAQSDLDSLDGLSERVSSYERLLEMCGKNGLPYRILSLVLPVINAEISKMLSGIVKFNVFFEADSDEQTVSLSIRYGDYRSRPLSLGSGAEKFISSLAIRVALLSVSSLPKTDILIIDEGFGKLDPEHLEALQRMFEYLREAFGSVFIVSHVDSMRDIVDHSIEITSRDGYAHVEVS